MKTVLGRYSWLVAGTFVSLLAVCSIAVHPFGAPKKALGDNNHLSSELKLPSDISAVFTRACMDCHSNQTVWPWYSYVAPMSWLVERDVHRGRSRLNLSDWSQYDSKQRQELLADIASAVKNREMPLPQYTLIHHHAKLSEADTDLVYDWARVERRKLRARVTAIPANTSQPFTTEPTQVPRLH